MFMLAAVSVLFMPRLLGEQELREGERSPWNAIVYLLAFLVPFLAGWGLLLDVSPVWVLWVIAVFLVFYGLFHLFTLASQELISSRQRVAGAFLCFMLTALIIWLSVKVASVWTSGPGWIHVLVMFAVALLFFCVGLTLVWSLLRQSVIQPALDLFSPSTQQIIWEVGLIAFIILLVGLLTGDPAEVLKFLFGS